MQRGKFYRHQNPRYQWVPKSTHASSSSSGVPKPSSAAAPPRPPGQGKGRGHRRRARHSWKGKPRGYDSRESRNWAEMPSDALSVIFEKIGPIEVLLSAQVVCRPWWRLANEKEMWRKVDFTVRGSRGDFFFEISNMALAAVDRSAGVLEEFSIGHQATDRILTYMAERSPRLKCLRLTTCYHVSDDALKETVMKLPLLEELNITFHSFSMGELLPTIGKSCPLLKSFHLNYYNLEGDEDVDLIYDNLEGDEDVEALAIAENMPKLRSLQLRGNRMTNAGLLAILEGCPHLEFLDLSECFTLKIDESLMKRCATISNLRLPSDRDFDHTFTATDDASDYEYYSDYDYELDDVHDIFGNFYAHEFEDIFMDFDDGISEIAHFRHLFLDDDDYL